MSMWTDDGSLVGKVADQERDIARLKGRVDAHSEKLRNDQAEPIRRNAQVAVNVQQNALRRMSPFRSRWPEVAEYDAQVADLERHQAAIAAELRDLHDRKIAAPAEDVEALADWELQGRDGARPEPSLPAIEANIKRLQGEAEGVTVAISRVLDAKAQFVERHRGRLTKEADAHTQQALERYTEAINELEAAREELAANRRAAVWAALYPKELAAQQPPDSFAGARKRALAPLGISAVVHPDRVFEALRSDASYLADACTPEQRLVMQGRDPRQPPSTEWINDPAVRARRDKVMAEWANSR